MVPFAGETTCISFYTTFLGERRAATRIMEDLVDKNISENDQPLSMCNSQYV
jgi:hypothetical protein